MILSPEATRMLCTARSSCAKVGDIPTAYSGLSRDESRSSCGTCALLHVKHGGQAASGRPMCYAQYGRVAWSHAAIINSWRAGRDCSIEAALTGRLHSARFVRLGYIGDPAATPVRILRAMCARIRAAGLGILSYTHQWQDRRRRLQGLALASCDSLPEVDHAVQLGYRATVILPAGTPIGARIKSPAGLPVTMCPHQVQTLAGHPQAITCNACGRCDHRRRMSRAIAVGFWDHGPTAQGKGLRA